MPIKLIIVEDHLLVLKALCRFLNSQESIEVVGTATDGEEAVRVAGNTCSDVILMDVSLPDLSGIEATRQITASIPGAGIIMLSCLVDDASVSASISAGAMGYIPKQCSMEELIAAIRSVYHGTPYLSAAVCAPIVRGFQCGQDNSLDSVNHPCLSPRETTVLHLFAEGYTLKSIGASLSISPRTVESHIARMKSKLGIRSLAGLVKYAVKNNITTLDT